MKSVIDWNEIVPMLKKELRDTLMLEAVLILSDRPGRRGRTLSQQVRVKHQPRTPGARSTKMNPRPSARAANGDRSWYSQGDGGYLSAPGRRYRINKSAANAPQRGKIGGVWKKLIESKNDSITYEGMAAICKGQGAMLSATIAQLWERNHIEVEAKKFIEAIPGK